MQSIKSQHMTQMCTPVAKKEADSLKPVPEEAKTGETMNETPFAKDEKSDFCSSEELRSDSSSDSSIRKLIIERT